MDSSTLSTIVMLVGMLAVFYFLLIRPQKKKEKQEKEMRESLEIGDGVITIGGIVGRVTGIKDDTITIETGSDRVKIRFQKWALQSVEKLDMEKPQ